MPQALAKYLHPDYAPLLKRPGSVQDRGRHGVSWRHMVASMSLQRTFHAGRESCPVCWSLRARFACFARPRLHPAMAYSPGCADTWNPLSLLSSVETCASTLLTRSCSKFHEVGSWHGRIRLRMSWPTRPCVLRCISPFPPNRLHGKCCTARLSLSETRVVRCPFTCLQRLLLPNCNSPSSLSFPRVRSS